MVMNRTRPTPISSAEVGGSRHLVPPYGGSDGVRNLRAAGKGELSRKGRTEAFHAVEVPVDQRGPVRPVSRSRRSCRGPRCSRSCLMPGIIRCPESTAIQAGNPDRRGRGEDPGVSACSAGPGFGFRVGVVNARTALSSSSRSAFPLRGWSRGGGGCGRMPAGGSVSLRRQATCGDGGPEGIAARMLAASPAGMPAVLALPRGITVAAASPAGPGPGTVRRGRLMTEAWSCGGPGQFAGRGGCRWRAEVPGHLGRALPGRRRGTLDSVRIRSDPRRMRAPGPGRPGGRSSGFWQGGTGGARQHRADYAVSPGGR